MDIDAQQLQAEQNFLKTYPLPGDLRRAFPVGMRIPIGNTSYWFPAIRQMPLVGVRVQTLHRGDGYATTAYVIAYPAGQQHLSLSADVLLWLPAVNMYGYYLYYARKLKVYVGKTWTDIEANPALYLTHKLAAVNLEAVVPLSHYLYPVDTNLPVLAKELLRAAPTPRILHSLEDHIGTYERAHLYLPYHRDSHEAYHALIEIYEYLATHGPESRRLLYLAKATALNLRWHRYVAWLKKRPSPFTIFMDDDVKPFISDTLLFNHVQWSGRVKGFMSWIVIWGLVALVLEALRWVVRHGGGWG